MAGTVHFLHEIQCEFTRFLSQLKAPIKGTAVLDTYMLAPFFTLEVPEKKE